MGLETIQSLAERIREMEATERRSCTIPLTNAALANVLPDGGLPGGALVELLSASEGGGAWTLALLLIKQACTEGKTLVVADAQGCFYPPAACRLGIDLRRTLVVRTQGQENALAALVSSLRCAAVGAAIGSFQRLNATEYRRLQLAAEVGGGVGFLLLPASALGAPSFAAVRLLVSPAPRPGKAAVSRRWIQVEVVRVRGAKAGRSFLLEIDHETGNVCVPSLLATPAPDASPA